MNNFSFEYNGKTYWYSRSVACSMYLFVYEKISHTWYILVSRRGPGCPSNIGKWNVPGGYLDFNETLEGAAKRECWEETGIKIEGEVKLANISTNPHSKAQNVVCSFYKTIEVNNISDLTWRFSNIHNEQNEVSDIKLWKVSLFFDFPDRMTDTFAFGHDKMIREIFKKRIQIPDWKRRLINKVEKLTKIDLRIS